jgi:hypothetical protein
MSASPYQQQQQQQQQRPGAPPVTNNYYAPAAAAADVAAAAAAAPAAAAKAAAAVARARGVASSATNSYYASEVSAEAPMECESDGDDDDEASSAAGSPAKSPGVKGLALTTAAPAAPQVDLAATADLAVLNAFMSGAAQDANRTRSGGLLPAARLTQIVAAVVQRVFADLTEKVRRLAPVLYKQGRHANDAGIAFRFVSLPRRRAVSRLFLLVDQ